MRHHVTVFVRIWQYDVTPERAAEFERIYGADGEWAHLFAASAGYLGTELFKQTTHPPKYLTVDRFTSETAWHEFLAEHGNAYVELDRMTQGLTVAEQELAATELG